MTQRNRKAGWKHEPEFDAMDKQSDRLIRHIDRYFAEFFGKRCRSFEEGCPVCDGYALRDKLYKFIK